MDQYVAVHQRLWDGFANKSIKGNSLLVFTTLCQFMPRIFPSVRMIAARSGLDRKTVHRHLNILEARNVIKRIRRWGTSSIYEINPALLRRKTVDAMRQFITKKTKDWAMRKKRYTPYPIPVPVSGSLTSIHSILTRGLAQISGETLATPAS